MSGIFGGVTFPLKRTFSEYESTEHDLRQFGEHAFVDRFSIDLESGMIILGPRAREFHGLSAEDGGIGMRHFLECYHEADRPGLLDLLERLACDGRPFHYTARLEGPGGRFVHGFISRGSDGNSPGAEWSGVVVMSRSGLAPAGSPGDYC